MSFQIDYIAVGDDSSSCGDAIALRYWDSEDPSSQKIAVIDGGTLKSGQDLVNHIISEYRVNKVDYVFSTHLDRDHLSGLRIVLEQLEVGTLFMHLPWDHASETSDLYKKDLTQDELESKLQKALDQVRDVEETAFENDVSVEEIFTGDIIDSKILVLGPSKEYYEVLTSQFRDTPEPKSAFEEAREAFSSLQDKIEGKIPQWIYDKLDWDILGDGGETSAENNSSLILLFIIDGHKLLFSGDAGIPALTAAVNYSESKQLPLTDLRFFHVPHHGSKHNLGSSLLKRIKSTSAIISSAANCPDHPSKRVTNALHKNGTKTNSTAKDGSLLHEHEAPRENWTPREPIPFFESFQE